MLNDLKHENITCQKVLSRIITSVLMTNFYDQPINSNIK